MPSITAVEQRVLDAIDRDTVAQQLADLIAVPSISGTDTEVDIQHALAGQLEALGLDVDLWRLDLPALAAAPGYPGTEVDRGDGWGLVGTSAGEDGAVALVLQGHVDVVPPGDRDRWRAAPFAPTWRGTRVHGRGACDMKAGVVANLAAYAAIVRSGTRLRRKLALHLAIGEEDGGLGAFATLQRGHSGDACIITEPTSGTVVTGAAGALTFSVQLFGKATHASTPYAGHSVLDSYVKIHHALARLSEQRNRVVEPLMAEYPVPYAIVIGTLRAGDWPSSVPDRLVAHGRMGLRVDEDPHDARGELENWLSATAADDVYLRDHPPVVRWSGGQYAGGRMPAGHGLRGLVADAHSDAHTDVRRGTQGRERGVPYGSDLRLYAGAGVPTVHYGPGDAQLAHGPEESVDLDEVIAVTRALALTAIRSCGTR